MDMSVDVILSPGMDVCERRRERRREHRYRRTLRRERRCRRRRGTGRERRPGHRRTTVVSIDKSGYDRGRYREYGRIET
jgi:hypothetical protein